MNLTLRLRFRTYFGQTILVSGEHEVLGNGDPEKALPLQYLDTESWQATVSISDDQIASTPISYHYILQNPDGTTIHDWGNGRSIIPASFKQNNLLVIDSWNHAGFHENAFYTEPFRQVLLRSNHTEVRNPAPEFATHTFKIKAPLLSKGQTLCLLGEGEMLGNWNTNTAAPILLNRIADEDFLSVQLDLSGQSFPIAYKYGVYDIERKTFVCYEGGANRALHDVVAPNKYTLVDDGF